MNRIYGKTKKNYITRSLTYCKITIKGTMNLLQSVAYETNNTIDSLKTNIQ